MDIPNTNEEWDALIKSTLAGAAALVDKKKPSPPFEPIVTNEISPDILARYIDHTLLNLDATTPQLNALCDEALQWRFSAVCVRAARVSQCRKYLRGTHAGEAPPQGFPRIAAVVGFPEGTYSTTTKCADAYGAVQDGASELDMVLNYELLKSGNFAAVYSDIRAVRTTIDGPIHLNYDPDHAPTYGTSERPVGKSTIGRGTITLKVILETSQLTPEQVVAGSVIAIRAGADFIKTSTDLRGRGASREDIQLMRIVAHLAGPSSHGGKVKIKASGGIRSIEDCLNMVNAGADRIGTSAGARILEAMRAGKGGSHPVHELGTSIDNEAPIIDDNTIDPKYLHK